MGESLSIGGKKALNARPGTDCPVRPEPAGLADAVPTLGVASQNIPRGIFHVISYLEAGGLTFQFASSVGKAH